jgi:hypothetical protein
LRRVAWNPCRRRHLVAHTGEEVAQHLTDVRLIVDDRTRPEADSPAISIPPAVARDLPAHLQRAAQ